MNNNDFFERHTILKIFREKNVYRMIIIKLIKLYSKYFIVKMKTLFKINNILLEIIILYNYIDHINDRHRLNILINNILIQCISDIYSFILHKIIIILIN